VKGNEALGKNGEKWEGGRVREKRGIGEERIHILPHFLSLFFTSRNVTG